MEYHDSVRMYLDFFPMPFEFEFSLAQVWTAGLGRTFEETGYI